LKRLILNLSLSLINATNLNINTLPKLRIAFVCAQHEHVRTYLKALKKNENTNFSDELVISAHEIIPEGVSPLCAKVTLGSISKWQAGLS